jgi:hypothetical protein
MIDREKETERETGKLKDRKTERHRETMREINQ